ncbi:MAG: hypothetical protein EBZ91_11815 [Gammaproteobacteria bacterium]|nr:hypothetical protein [Gammaproteobacteria bacterium]
MAEKKRNRIFWLEGVTEHEVLKSLNDRAPSRFRQQAARRRLVVTMAVLIFALAVQTLLPATKLQTYLEFTLLAAVVVLYFVLRKAVRHIADSPTELLDERQIAARDAAFTVAYRLLAVAFTFYVLLYIAHDVLQGDPSPGSNETRFGVMALWISAAMLAAALPAMVLAWNLPSEPAVED